MLLENANKLPKDRNAAIHGCLDWDLECDKIVFCHKKGALPANLSEIQRITTDILRVFEEVVMHYEAFIKSIPQKPAETERE
jgi:hypothetical protein